MSSQNDKTAIRVKGKKYIVSGKNISFKQHVRINWSGEKFLPWSEICVWVLENFGLPGDRYITNSTDNYLEFNFVSKKDTTAFILKWGQHLWK